MRAWMITRPIPTKRELKDVHVHQPVRTSVYDHKANPDEKGTESRLFELDTDIDYDHKANPDEKGTESSLFRYQFRLFGRNHKANPDEKGTESDVSRSKDASLS